MIGTSNSAQNQKTYLVTKNIDTGAKHQRDLLMLVSFLAKVIFFSLKRALNLKAMAKKL